MRREIEFLPNGDPRTEKQVAWFYLHLETGDAAQAARDAGYSEKSAANIGWNLKRDFASLIFKAMQYQGVVDLPFARATLLKVMRAYDPDAQVESVRVFKDGSTEAHMIPDPAKAGAPMGAIAIKAAEAYMDRFGLPKQTNLVIDHGESDVGDDFRKLIDRLVVGGGLDSVRQNTSIMAHKEYRDYLEGKYGKLKEIEEITEEE